MKLNLQVIKLNNEIRNSNPTVYSLLSEKGKSIYFPKDGILAQTAQARGSRINGTIGSAFEEDGSPMRLHSISGRIKLPPEEVFPYAPSFGKADLRNIWKKLIFKKNPSLKGAVSTPVVTSGLTHALSIIAYLFVEKNDRIIIPDKFWGNYRLVFEYGFSGVFDTFNTFSDNGFDLVSFEKKLTSAKGEKIIILLNFPNNPSGYTPTVTEAKEIARIIKSLALKGMKVLILIDDAYFGLVYEEGIFKESLFSLLANIHKNVLAVKLDAATKEEYVWGLRIGFITYASTRMSDSALTALEDKTAGVVRGNISNASHLSQSLILNALNSPSYRQEKTSKFHILKKRYRKVKDVLKRHQEYNQFFRSLPFNSGYFMCLELKNGQDAEKVRQILLKKYSTGVIAAGKLIRIAYSSVPQKYIEEVFENIYQSCRICLKNL